MKTKGSDGHPPPRPGSWLAAVLLFLALCGVERVLGARVIAPARAWDQQQERIRWEHRWERWRPVWERQRRDWAAARAGGKHG